MKKSTKRDVRQRAGDECEYCRFPAWASSSFHIDHVVAKKHRGPTDPDNLALACDFCNSRKGTDLSGIDPRTARVVRLFNPRRHRWAQHFAWRGATLVGLTPTGRATIEVLCMNHELQLARRQELIDNDLFPSD